VAADAVELTAEQAWFVADAVAAGSYPWVLAITPPFSDPAERLPFVAERVPELIALGVLRRDGSVDPVVAQWVTTVCRAERWLDLRFVRHTDMLRGIVACRGGRTVVALRSGPLVTFTELSIDHPQALVPVVTVGLAGRAPARFDEFALPADAGARADQRIRDGAPVRDVLDFLAIPPSARAVVEAAFDADRSYVEVVAGEHRDGQRVATGVGVSVVDTTAGRVVVSPVKAYDGQWVSTFAPGTPFAVATALERLTGSLPGGPWFPDLHLARDFDDPARTSAPRTTRRREPCPTTPTAR
jgi:hypothetical protein